MHIIPAYAYFCDDNGLQRIDATPAQKAENLRLLILAAREEINQIKDPPRVSTSHWGLH